MKKTFVLVMILTLPLFFGTTTVEAKTKAKTLRELKKELTNYKNQKKTNQNNQAATKNEIANAENSVSNKQNEISNNQNKIETATKESEKLEIEIAEGKDELNNLQLVMKI